MVELHEEFKSQLKTLADDYEASVNDDWEISRGEVEEYLTRSLAAIYRIADPTSVYYERAMDTLNTNYWHDERKLEYLIAVIRALYKDMDSGFIHRFGTIVRGEVFDDFLEMAKHLSDEGYKDAAAVIAGSSLESHLRQLCLNQGMDIERQVKSGKRPVSADEMNVNLARAGVYNVNQQKNITFCLDLRNNAAHGKYDEYDSQQVVLMIDSVRHFIARNPQ